jgi:OOP family OmpA-OmpF porin
MKARTLLCLAFAAAAAVAGPAAAQTGTATGQATMASPYSWLQAQRPYVGLTLGRPRGPMVCSTSSLLLCEEAPRTSQLYAGAMIGSFWGAELGYLQSGRLLRDGSEGRSQGLNLSLVGKARLGSSFGVFGRVGTTYSRTESSVFGSGLAGGADQGFGLSYGGGVSYDFTPRLSARLEWDSHDFRFGGNRDPVRSTSLGLQYRY